MSNEVAPVVQIHEEDIIQVPPAPVKKKPGPKPKAKTESLPAPVSKVGYERPRKEDPIVANRREFAEVMEEGRRHATALARSIKGTTPAGDYITILFTPTQVHFMKALLLTQKAPVAEEILVKFDSAL